MDIFQSEINGTFFFGGTWTSPSSKGWHRIMLIRNQKHEFGIKIGHINPSQHPNRTNKLRIAAVIIDMKFHRNVYTMIIKMLSTLRVADTESSVFVCKSQLALLQLYVKFMRKCCRKNNRRTATKYHSAPAPSVKPHYENQVHDIEISH